MILAIDGYEANVSKRVGIGRYAYEILCNMYKILSQKNGNGFHVRVYLPSKPLHDMPKPTSWWEYKVAGPTKLWTFIGLPWALFKDMPRADVVFSPTHYIPRFIRIPRVMSIMDMSFLEYPELFRQKDLYQLTKWTQYSASRAARILTISEFSKNAILKAYRVPNHRVIVTYPGLITMKQSSKNNSTHMATPYILSVGTIQPRKNYIRLIEAFSLALPELKNQHPEITLVIVGKKGWLYEDIIQAPHRLGVSKHVKFLEFVSDESLPSLYTSALCFTLPSLYEGFGLPVLEAMAYKCPVVVSDVSSLPEIAGKAGVYVDPEDVQSIAHGLIEGAASRESVLGRNRIAEGLKQVKKFTWEKAASDTLAILKQVGKAGA
jgi:glycosyltransferase involved in cell wall biosynthesis